MSYNVAIFNEKNRTFQEENIEGFISSVVTGMYVKRVTIDVAFERDMLAGQF